MPIIDLETRQAADALLKPVLQFKTLEQLRRGLTRLERIPQDEIRDYVRDLIQGEIDRRAREIACALALLELPTC